MAKSFQGTSTGRTYEAGRLYSNGNGTFRAEADGSFTNVKSGKSLEGSRAAVAAAEARAERGDYSGYVQHLVRPGVGPGVGVNSNGVAMPSGVSTGSGNAAVASSTAAISSDDGPAKTTPLFFGGLRLGHDPSTSDGGDYEDRWGEVGGAVMGLGVMVKDLSAGANAYLQSQSFSQSIPGQLLEDLTSPPDYSFLSGVEAAQVAANKEANRLRLERAHETGLGAIIGNPFQPGSIFDTGTWWK